MGISSQEFQRRYREIREAMKKERLDCLLIVGLNEDFNRGNIRYVTGLGRGGCCIFPLEGRPVFLANPVLTASRKLPKFMAAVDLLDLETTADPRQRRLFNYPFRRGKQYRPCGQNVHASANVSRCGGEVWRKARRLSGNI